MMKRVGIMGGTFNPIHLGHLIIAENAYEELGLDEVLFIPSCNSYMKKISDVEMLDPKTRIDLVGEAISDNSHFALSTIEVDRGGDTYTYETIAELKKQNPDTEYIFIIGADTLYTIEQWKHPEKIFSEVQVATAIRGGFIPDEVEKQILHLEETFQTKLILLHSRSVDICSQQIRDRVKEGKSIRYMVHYKTAEVIRKKGLYIDKD